MEWDDIVYLVLLLSSILFGLYYREVKDNEKRKQTGTLAGLGIIILVSGLHVLHVFIFTFVNILIIQSISKKKCHLISFIFSFTYLIFFRTSVYFGIPYAPAHTNLIVMVLTLKLVGLAFEINSSYMLYVNNKKQKEQKHEELTQEQIAEQNFRHIKPTTMEIVHYAFNYCGVLAGPYLTYRSFYDSFHTSFRKHAKCSDATLQKLTYVPLYAVLFLIVSYIWPFSYALTDEFYNVRSVWYRLWYCIPVFFVFRMRISIGVILSECACSMVGLGAYPIKSTPKPGAGPTTNFVHLKEILAEEKKASVEQYDFETIRNVNVYHTEFCLTMRDAMKNWNMTIQYWLAVNVYKRFPSKQFRTFATLFISAVWHGFYIGHYFTICGAPFYLPIEDIYFKLFIKDPDNKYKKRWEWIIWISKMLSLSYLALAFHLLTMPKVMHYYNSVYHIGFIIYAILYVIGLQLIKMRRKATKTDKTQQPLKKE